MKDKSAIEKLKEKRQVKYWVAQQTEAFVEMVDVLIENAARLDEHEKQLNNLQISDRGTCQCFNEVNKQLDKLETDVKEHTGSLALYSDTVEEQNERLEKVEKRGFPPEGFVVDWELVKLIHKQLKQCPAPADHPEAAKELPEDVLKKELLKQRELWELAKPNLDAYDKQVFQVDFMGLHQPIESIDKVLAAHESEAGRE